MVTRVNTAGVDTMGRVRLSTVEVEITSGIGIHMVGLADVVAKEMLLRVVTAIQSLGFSIPGRKIVISFNPTNHYKKSTNFDVAVAVGILVASGQVVVKEDLLERCLLCGELGLDGSIREGDPYRGYEIAKEMGELIGERPLCLLTGRETALQAGLVTDVLTYSFGSLGRLLEVLAGRIYGTSWLVWNTREWQEMEEGAERIKYMSQRPL